LISFSFAHFSRLVETAQTIAERNATLFLRANHCVLKSSREPVPRTQHRWEWSTGEARPVAT
jgi:hypothetical protein